MKTAQNTRSLALLVRDPWWIFAYWRVGERGPLTLRVYEVSGVELPNCRAFFDIGLSENQDHWYVDVGKPDSEWIAEIGVRQSDGRFESFVRSNRVKTPRAMPSEKTFSLSSYSLFKIEDE